MKKALIDQILIGLFIFIVFIVVGATIADNIQARVEIEKIRTIVQNAALSSAKYYSYEDDTTSDAESKTNELISKSNLGNEVKDKLTYTWDFVSTPNNVKVKVDHTIDYFWYRFLGLKTSEPFTLEAKAEIMPDDTDPRCLCGQTPGVGLVGRTLCVVGTDLEEQVQIASDSIKWKVKSVFENGGWEQEVWFNQLDVDNVIVITFNGNDQIQLNDLSVPTLVDGGCGDDQIQGSTGQDTIYGNEGDDQIEGKEGDDIIYGGNGDDQLQGGDGDDNIYKDSGDSTVDGGNGTNTIQDGTGYSDDCLSEVAFECGQDNIILVY